MISPVCNDSEKNLVGFHVIIGGKSAVLKDV